MSAGDPLAHMPLHIQAAFAIPNPALISEVFAVLGANHNEMVHDYEPIDKHGCWITPKPPADAAALEQAIAPTLAQGHWIVTSLKDGRVLIEPRHTRFIEVQPPGPVHHVSSRKHRSAIQANGLE